jgi:DsbC/DsbD-like thiol-disulfide interchange protein
MKIAIAMCFLLCLCFSVPAHAQPKADLQAVANVSAIVPGQPFMLGFKFSIQPGWHIYWTNPGDSGLPTQIKLNLPPGFTAGKILFPIPTRLQLPGDIVNYAYENQVMFMVRVTPPNNLPAGQTITLAGNASWLVCQDECIPGKSDWSVTLPVAKSAAAVNEVLFQTWTNRLPVKEDSSEMSSWSISMSPAKKDLWRANLEIHWKKVPNDFNYYPAPPSDGDVENVNSTTSGNLTKVKFDISTSNGKTPTSEAFGGLLVFTNASGARVGVEMSFPPALVPSLP